MVFVCIGLLKDIHSILNSEVETKFIHGTTILYYILRMKPQTERVASKNVASQQAIFY